MSRLLFLTLLLCFSNSIAYSQKLDFSILTVPNELKQNANSVVRFENHVVEINSKRSKTVKIEKAITVFNKFADSQADLSIFYDNRVNIKSVKMYFYDGLGNELKKVKKSDFNDYSASDGFSLYNDGRLIHYDYVPVTYPYTVHYEYEYQTSNTGGITSWYPIRGFAQSLENSTFSLIYPENFEVKTDVQHLENFGVSDASSGNSLLFEAKNVSAIKYEPNAPSFKTIVPSIKVSLNKFSIEGIDGTAANWKEFGKWQYEYFYKDVGGVSEATAEKIKTLTKDAESDIEKAKIIYNYVQDKVRYISVQVGIGGLRPMLATDVDDLGYGDCKALTNYTKSLLDAVGVESYFTELYGGEDKESMNINLPSVHGNHVILNLPNGDEDIWLECTSQNVPFGHIAGFTDDRDVIVVKPEGGFLKHTTVYADTDNHQNITGNYSVDEKGAIKGRIYMESSGNQFDNHLHYEGKDRKQLDKLYKEFWDNIDNMSIATIQVKNNKEQGKFEEEITFSATNYGAVSGDRMILPINAFNVIESAPKRMRTRKLEVEVERGFYDVDVVNVELPSGYAIEALSENVSIDTKYGTYEMTIEKKSETNLVFHRKFLLKTGRYSKEEYNDYRNFLRQVVKKDKSKIVLIKI